MSRLVQLQRPKPGGRYSSGTPSEDTKNLPENFRVSTGDPFFKLYPGAICGCNIHDKARWIQWPDG